MTTIPGIIAGELHSIGIPYEYMRWTSKVDGAYVIGEHTEIATFTEDGHKESTFLLTATTRTTWEDLERIRSVIEDHFPSIFGRRIPTDNGVVVVYYSNSFPVYTGEADLMRIQINLSIEQWRYVK